MTFGKRTAVSNFVYLGGSKRTLFMNDLFFPMKLSFNLEKCSHFLFIPLAEGGTIPVTFLNAELLFEKRNSFINSS